METCDRIGLGLALVIETAVLFAVYFALLSYASAYEIPGQTPAPPVIGDLIDRSEAWWGNHGVSACPDGVTAWQAHRIILGGQDAWGAGDGATCEMWVSDSLVDWALDPLWIGDAIQACAAVAHEVGHAYGLPHSARGVMSVTGRPARLYGWAPRFCFRWARFEYAAVARGNGESEKSVRAMIRYQEHLIHTPA